MNQHIIKYIKTVFLSLVVHFLIYILFNIFDFSIYSLNIFRYLTVTCLKIFLVCHLSRSRFNSRHTRKQPFIHGSRTGQYRKGHLSLYIHTCACVRVCV